MDFIYVILYVLHFYDSTYKAIIFLVLSPQLSLYQLHQHTHLRFNTIQFLASFLGGFAFIFQNRSTFLSLSMVLSGQILWQNYCCRKNSKAADSDSPITKCRLLLDKIPFARLIFPLNMAFLLHSYFFNHRIVSGVARGMINGFSHNEYVHKNIL